MVFEPALAELSTSDQSLFGPTSFRDYVRDHDVDTSPRTARYISVDSLADLPSELRESEVMVLRMGSAADGTGTAFVLVPAPDGIESYFLQDEELFADQQAKRLEAPVEHEQLLSFHLLPSLSETSLVNLGLASGVLAEALELDTKGALAPPATGRSTFTFDVRPHDELTETVTHRSGQVEIDTLFAERRNGEQTLFVLEAKTGMRASLAKHKLVYPILALADAVPEGFKLVPTYLRCRRLGDAIRFEICECELPDPRKTAPGVNALEVNRTSIIELDHRGN